MSFRCSVKDNAEGGGCAQYEDLEFEVVSSAGPFVVTAPSLLGITWEAFTNEEVTWNVANTTSAPINADFVDIFLSVDGGLTYPITLAEDVPNNGSASVVVPNVPTSEARVMVMNSHGTFFDISNFDFTIIGLTNGFLILADDTTKSGCVGDDLVFDISLEGVGGFDEMITLSLEGDISEVNATLANDMLMAGESTTLTITETDGIDAGVLEISINGTAPSFQQSLMVEAGFNSIVPEIPVLALPENEAQFLPTDLILDWESAQSPDAIYTIEISTDPSFESDIITLVSAVTSEVNASGLNPATTYYWRVMKETSCSVGDFSEAFSFGTHSCFPFISEDVPVNISSVAGVFTSELEIPFEGIVQDLNVINIEGNHGNTGQLTISLVSPSGLEVVLLDEVCNGTNDFDLGFDDSSDLEEIDCPATTGLSYRPDESLSSFIGENTQGTWTLVVADAISGAGGSINNWAIEVCVANSGSFVLTKDTEVSQVCQGQSATFEVMAEEVFAFDGAINLSSENVPAGMTIEFEPVTINTGQSSLVTISVDAALASESYFPTIIGVSGELTNELADHPIEVNLSNPQAVELLSPSDDATISTIGFFEWEENVSPSSIYSIEVATDDLFTDIVETIVGLTEPSITLEDLPPSQTLFWQVTADNGCAASSSLVRSFTTLACATSAATDGLPLNISPISGIYSSELEIEQAGVIQSISIPTIEGNHFRVSDLVVSLESPSGNEVVLFSNICAGEQDFNLGFLDGTNPEIDCPATTGELYAPEEFLSAFEGEDAQGTWTLNVNDVQNGGGGQLNAWSLQICYEENVFSTNNTKDPELSIFPNPTSDFITISSKDGNIDEMLVYDISGRLLDRILVKGNNTITLDFSKYAKGGYLIEVRSPFGVRTEKVMRK
jgi:subtilisin-like proprotein convertase family protein